MATFRTAAMLCICAAAFSMLLTAAVAVGEPASAGDLRLPQPLGSGLNKPVSLGYTPRRGRRFIALMRQFVQAARGGNMDLAQKLQQQLFSLTKPKHHRRHLLQKTPRGPAGPLEDACPALPDTVALNVTSPSGAQQSSGPTGPLPSIRFATLEPCAEFGCRGLYSLVRTSSGAITCRGPRNAPAPPPGKAAPVPPVAVLPFSYFKVYDYDKFWNTDDDNVLAGGYAGTVVQNLNQLSSTRGAAGLNSQLSGNTQIRVEPNPLLAVRADTEVSGEANTGVEVSKAVGDNAVLGFKTALPRVTATGAYGAVLPGTVVSDRAGDAADDNVVFRTNAPALFGYFGKKH